MTRLIIFEDYLFNPHWVVIVMSRCKHQVADLAQDASNDRSYKCDICASQVYLCLECRLAAGKRRFLFCKETFESRHTSGKHATDRRRGARPDQPHDERTGQFTEPGTRGITRSSGPCHRTIRLGKQPCRPGLPNMRSLGGPRGGFAASIAWPSLGGGFTNCRSVLLRTALYQECGAPEEREEWLMYKPLLNPDSLEALFQAGGFPATLLEDALRELDLVGEVAQHYTVYTSPDHKGYRGIPHIDRTRSVLIVLTGAKCVYVLPPLWFDHELDGPSVDAPHVVISETPQNGSSGVKRRCILPAHAYGEDRKAHFRNLICDPSVDSVPPGKTWRCIRLGPGQALIIPAGWLHVVDSTAGTVSVTAAFPAQPLQARV